MITSGFTNTGKTTAVFYAIQDDKTEIEKLSECYFIFIILSILYEFNVGDFMRTNV